MARFLVLCALIGVTLANLTPANTLPKSVLGVYENIPSESKNFEEFVTVFGLPKHAKFDQNNLIGLVKEGDSYVQRFAYWPSTLTFDLPFKLGETQTKNIRGKQFEYVYTLETGETPETPVLRIKFRQVDGDIKFTVEAAFTKEGINATYARDNIVAKRTYRRTLPPYVLGAYELDPTSITPESRDYFNNAYPLPGGLKWTSDTKFFFGREGDDFVDKMIINHEYFFMLRFKLDQPTTIKYDGKTLTATYSVVELGTNKTTIRTEMTTPQGNVVYNTVFERKGVVTSTIKTADNKEFSARYNRVLPWLFLGHFEEIPEKTENWEEFIKGDENMPADKTPKSFKVYRKKDGEYVYRKIAGDKTVDMPFKLDTPTEAKLPNGKTVKYNATVVSGNNTFLIIHSQTGDKRYTLEQQVKPCGIAVTYRRDGVEAKKYYRRVLPKTVLGTFESPEYTTDEEFKKYATAHGTEDLLKKTTVEFSETPDHKYHKKMTTEGEEPKDVDFTLGEPVEVTCKKTGKTLKARAFYHETDNKPTLLTVFFTPDNKPVMRITRVFTPTGFEASVVYGIPEGQEKIARRTFTRKGAAVPFELPTTA